MSAGRGLRARLRSLLYRRSADQSLADEIRFHLEMETERLIRQGFAPAEARRRARLEFPEYAEVRDHARTLANPETSSFQSSKSAGAAASRSHPFSGFDSQSM